MNRIRLLADSVKKKIAAGEVIEGPFSVVKELMENSLDAGATLVDVQVADSGLKRITVRDNGSGIHQDDLKLAIAEHATSKISDIHDIETISSYGFRGEALSSISAVSELTMLSRRGGEEMGGRLESGSRGVTLGDYAGSPGTTVIVENLFYNVPARKKFLKARRSELRSIRELFLGIALAAPGAGFTLDVDGKRHITLAAAKSLDERMIQVYGRDVFDNLTFSRLQDIKVSVSGYFSRPGYMKPTRSLQLLYVNNRPVEYKYLGFVLSRAYEGVAIRGNHPVAFIFIDIDPALIDVNIHPAKREVKLFDQKYIDTLLMRLAGKALEGKQRVDPGLFRAVSNLRNMTPGLAGGRLFEPAAGGQGGTAVLPSLEAGNYDDVVPGEDRGNDAGSGNDAPGRRILGVAFGTYIVYENGDALELIDFHAAHERIIYDSLTAPDAVFESQALAFPVMMELPSADYHLVLDHLGDFTAMGFDMDDFSDNTVMVRAVPVVSKDSDVKQVISGFLESLKSGGDGPAEIRDRIAASLACHAARRSGERLAPEEMRSLVDKVLRGDLEARCPHGRPFIYRISKNDLERMFKRQ